MPRHAKSGSGKLRHDPLHVEIDADDQIKKYGNVSRPGKRKGSKNNETEAEEVDYECIISKILLNVACHRRFWIAKLLKRF
jgi:essential nuclear protein 1